MLKNLQKAQCNFTAQNIRCMMCDKQQIGGFHPDYGIMLCQNHLPSRKDLETTLTHEMLHAFDHCRLNVDWKNLKHHACSEIRASSLSGDCRWVKEFFSRGYSNFTKQHQACVRRRGALSVQNNPNCDSLETAQQAINEVFDSCFRDKRPFDEIY